MADALVLALALGVLLLAAPAASAAPIAAKPSFSITAAKKSGKKVRFTISVAVPGATACSKRVKAETKLTPHKSVSWSGQLKKNPIGCLAKISGSLSVTKFEKSVKFHFSFPGSAAIKKFNKKKSLKLSPPPPPPGQTPPAQQTPSTGPPSTKILVPQPGKWGSTDQSGPSDGFTVYVQADGTTSIQGWGTSKALCGDPEQLSQVLIHSEGWSFQTIVDSANGSHHWLSGNSDINYNVSLHFSGPNSGSGTFSSVGGYDFGDSTGVQSCHTSETFNLYGPIP